MWNISNRYAPWILFVSASCRFCAAGLYSYFLCCSSRARTIHFLSLLLPCFPNSLTPEAQLWRRFSFLSQFLFGPYLSCDATLPMFIILMCSLHPTCFYKDVQDYLLPFQLCSQETAGTKSPSSYLLIVIKRADTRAAQLLVKMPTSVLPFNQYHPCWKKKRKKIL